MWVVNPARRGRTDLSGVGVVSEVGGNCRRAEIS